MTFNVEVLCFTAKCQGALRGFAMVKVVELNLIVRDVRIFAKGGRAWAGMPGRPWIKNGGVVVGADNKIRWTPIIEFDDDKARTAFSNAVIAGVLARFPRALDECAEAAQ